jgi:CHAT domain-containing protein/Tfp pilus assembly protein PilF
MKLGNGMVRLAALCLASGPLMAQAASSSSQGSNELRPGIVVEKVAENSEAKKAGIQTGDILLQWTRGNVQGEFQSPFDLTSAEIEQAPCGAVTLAGFRGAEARTWKLGPDSWGIQVRPNFLTAQLVIYREGEERAVAGKLNEAGEKWRVLAAQSGAPDSSWLHAWLLVRTAQLHTNVRQWTEADQLHDEATRASAAARPEVQAQLQRSWGETFMLRSDWEHASEHVRQAIAVEQATGSETLGLALALDDLGSIAQKQGDPAKADSCYQQALHIREQLAPDSLAVAVSLNNVGALAEDQGDLDNAEASDQRALALAHKIAPGGLTDAQAFGNLGDVAFDRGKLTTAKDYYSRSLEIRKKLEPDSLDVATAFHRMAWVAWKRGDLAKSEAWHRQALAIRETLAPGSPDVAASFHSLGNLARARGDLDQAQEYYHQALALREKLAPGSLRTADSLNTLGLVALDRGDLAKADDYYRQALRIRQRFAPDSLDIAQSFIYLGAVARKRGDLAKAEEYDFQALTIQEKLAPGSLDVAASLNNLGIVVLSRGDLPKAEDYHHQALAIREKLAPGSLDVAASLNNLGVVVLNRGDLATAEEYHHQALAIREKLAPGSLDVAMSLNNLGFVVWLRGDLATAEEYHHQALAIRQKLAPVSLDVAESLNNLGLVAWQRGDLATAEKYHRQALTIRERLAPSSLDVAESFINIGLIAHQRGDLAKAEEDYGKALTIHQKLAPSSVDIAWNLNRLARLIESRGDLDAAERYYKRAMGIWEKLAPESEDQADALVGLASIQRRRGQLDAAAQLYEEGLNALEGQTARLGGTDEVRAMFRAKHEAFYREYIDLCIAQHNPELAFAVAERSRARTLLETMAAAHLDIHNGAAPDLLATERSLQAEIKAKSQRRLHLLSQRQSDDQIKAVENEISVLAKEYEDVEARIRSSSPVYAALTQPHPLSAREVQEQLLDADTLLLEYSLGKERSHLFLVSAHSLKTVALPKAATIESASRLVYHLLTAPNQQRRGETSAERLARLGRAEAEYPQAAARLSRIVLDPIAKLLSGKRLLIVSDGALHYVPFAALPLPGKPLLPLVAQHEVINLPSASVLAAVRRERMAHQPAAKTVAVLADPVFDWEDIRVKHARAPQPTRGDAVRAPGTQPESHNAGEQSLDFSHLTRSAADFGWQHNRSGEVYLPRLRFTRQEADAIAAAAPGGQVLEALDFGASRATATSAALANYRIIHFATHALLNSRHPELSGLVLSLVDERGNPQNGFLGLEDIYNLNLPADLVVLSACDTALGKEINGEGLIGLTRGFMYAGAGRVMASLWSIDDRATAELMGHFYGALLREGKTPAAALREAQLRMRKNQHWRSPYFWASFQIQGDY